MYQKQLENCLGCYSYDISVCSMWKFLHVMCELFDLGRSGFRCLCIVRFAKVVKRSVHFLTTCQKVNIGFVVRKEIVKHNIFEKIFLLWVNFLKEKTFDVL